MNWFCSFCTLNHFNEIGCVEFNDKTFHSEFWVKFSFKECEQFAVCWMVETKVIVLNTGVKWTDSPE